MRETRARERLRKAVEAEGGKVEFIEWEPIRAGAEKSGPAGGWTVFIEGGGVALGYNVKEALDSIAWEMQERRTNGPEAAGPSGAKPSNPESNVGVEGQGE